MCPFRGGGDNGRVTREVRTALVNRRACRLRMQMEVPGRHLRLMAPPAFERLLAQVGEDLCAFLLDGLQRVWVEAE